MEISGKKILLCDCEGSMELDGKALAKLCGGEAPRIHTQLCRAEIDNLRLAAADGAPVIVACTQEAPLFVETLAENGIETEVAFTNIRERAGWSEAGADARPKIAALLAEAALKVPETGSITLRSEGRVLVYGRDEIAIEAAKQLAPRLDVTVLLTGAGDLAPPRITDVLVFQGTIGAVRGHLGAFEVSVEGFAPARPSSRDSLAFEAPRAGAKIECDLILDLSGGAPLFPAPEKRDGYLNPDAANPALVQRALFDLSDLVGEYEKPLYVAYDAALCTHSRSRQTGCTRCLDICPTSAIQPDGDTVVFDSFICAGCGGCASVCPTGAVSYALPPGDTVFQRLRTLLGSYLDASGTEPVLLVHDPRHGDEMIAAIARHGRGLPANVLPFALNEVTQVGLDFLSVALAWGANRVVVLAGPEKRGELDGLAGQIGLAETTLAGLGHGSGRVALIDETDPEAVEALLWGLTAVPEMVPASFLPMGGKRTLTMLALRHLHASAPEPVDILPLPQGAPFGAIAVDVEGCTLCLACVSACPTGALLDNPDAPMVRFTEDACVQCGLCRATCPESVVTLVPRINFTEAARSPVLIKEEEPFNCVRCGKPFGTKSSIERVVKRLSDHSMFAGDDGALDRIKMCGDCRVVVQFEGSHPMAGGERPRTRTTDDYLRAREEGREDEDD